MKFEQLKNIVEAALLAADSPLTPELLLRLFSDDKEQPTRDEIKKVLGQLQAECSERGFELKKVASGYRYQTRVEMQPWVSKLRSEKPPRYSRAFLETLALIVYRQPIPFPATL